MNTQDRTIVREYILPLPIDVDYHGNIQAEDYTIRMTDGWVVWIKKMGIGMTHWTKHFEEIACAEGLADGRLYDTLAEWWEGTQRGDYMLWLLKKIGYNNDRTLRLLACRFVRETPVDSERTVWDLLIDERSRQAVVITERFANGEATKEELVAALEKAWGASWGASASAVATASWAAAATAAEVMGTAEATSWAAASAVKAAEVAAAAEEAVMKMAAAARLSQRKAAQAAQAVQAVQAVIIREMIPATEVQELYDRYIAQKNGVSNAD